MLSSGFACLPPTAAQQTRVSNCKYVQESELSTLLVERMPENSTTAVLTCLADVAAAAAAAATAAAAGGGGCWLLLLLLLLF